MNGKMTGSVDSLWRFPVKSFLGERIAHSVVTNHGIVGDRGYAIIDCLSENTASAKNVRDFPTLFELKARYTTTPVSGAELPPVDIELPDGETINSEDPGVNDALSHHLERKVRLERSNGGTPFMDANPVSVLTTGTLKKMNRLQPESDFDARRFRMNVIIETPEEDFVENDWPGKQLKIESGLQLAVIRPDERCIMTTLAQEDLPNDPEILKGLVRHNRIRVSETRKGPCAGVYAEVRVEGEVRIGDAVTLE